MAVTLKENPSLWTELKDRATSNGVTLVKCIKTGVDLPNSKVGIIAGDEESYQEFKEIFDPVIEKCHGFSADGVSTSNFDISQIQDSQIDPSGKIVLSTSVQSSRNLRGFQLPPCTDFLERRAVEKAIVKSLQSLEGDLAGDYMPLHGSRSFVSRRHGMDKKTEAELRAKGTAYGPDRMEILTTGAGRHWPDARGVYNNNAGDVFVTVNDEDHLQIMTRTEGGDIQANAARFADASQQILNTLQSQGFEVMTDERLGNITVSPANLGNGLRAGARMNIPNLSSRSDFAAITQIMGLEAENCVRGVCDVSSANVLGKTEVELVNTMIAGTSKLVKMEQALERGGSISSL
jgi:creatine kinase